MSIEEATVIVDGCSKVMISANQAKWFEIEEQYIATQNIQTAFTATGFGDQLKHFIDCCR